MNQASLLAGDGKSGMESEAGSAWTLIQYTGGSKALPFPIFIKTMYAMRNFE
jgi:hypothetical protein